ncbi:hypothetical protein, partial [Nitrosomonas sp. Nm58]|uniref:hypothetical protein n=1 Tax=Nitrosomonas sp. Nm58 TaxID=200126 RepID=UPI001C430C42
SPSRYSTLPHISPHRVSFKRIAAEGRLLRSFLVLLSYGGADAIEAGVIRTRLFKPSWEPR